MSVTTADNSGASSNEPEDEPDRFMERLAAELNGRAPLQARVERTVGGLVVRVVNPGAGWLTERVNCRREPLAGGELRFWWEWGVSIGPADDILGAAAAVQRVLTPELGWV
jgi:hypothetical protein